jgi:pantetheine-phosphate adenylyltransferase
VTRALYPGTFDPITNGHLDVIRRASGLFDELIIAVAESTHKDTYFTLAERKGQIEQTLAGMEKVRVISFGGLLAEEFQKNSVDVVIRGLRAVSDFEYELMLALMNRKLNEDFETVFLMPSEQYIYLHSSIVKEVFILGGDISSLVPDAVLKAFREKGRRRS